MKHLKRYHNRIGHHKFGFPHKHNPKKKLFRRIVFIAGIPLLFALVFLFIKNQPSKMLLIDNTQDQENTQLDNIASNLPTGQENADVMVSGTQSDANVLGASSQKKAAQVQTQTSVQSALTINGYGIAAGGGLIYLGQGDLNRYFELLKSLGVQWVRWDVDWSVVQKDGPSIYDWTGADRVAQTAQKYGLNSLGIITYTPKWASDKSCKSDVKCAPADPGQYGKFAGEVAFRYKDSITYLEIWNEPNYFLAWGVRPNAGKYAELLKAAYPEIKKLNPSAVVLSGGLAATSNEKDGSIGPLAFMKTLYAAGANKYFDAIALHPYTYPASPNYKAWWTHWQEISPIRKLMVDSGDAEKKIWFTEIGAPTGGGGKAYAANQVNGFKYGSDFMKESAQNDILKEALVIYQKNKDWMGPFFWYSLKDESDKKDTPENFFGLLRYDGSKKPAYDVFKNAILNNK
ncbi:MAG: hypothetical protein WCF93_03440 [Candidatus Moraniibacteriota bacterium]